MMKTDASKKLQCVKLFWGVGCFLGIYIINIQGFLHLKVVHHLCFFRIAMLYYNTLLLFSRRHW